MYYVIFEPRRSGKRRIFHRFISREFNHVLVLRDYGSFVAALEPMIGGISLQVFTWDAKTKLREAIKAGATAILYIQSPYMMDTPRYHFRGIYTCVSAVKAFLGLHGPACFWIITPEQLYRRLLKDSKKHRARLIYRAPKGKLNDDKTQNHGDKTGFGRA